MEVMLCLNFVCASHVLAISKFLISFCVKNWQHYFIVVESRFMGSRTRASAFIDAPEKWNIIEEPPHCTT